MLRLATLLIAIGVAPISAQELKANKLEVGQVGMFPKPRASKQIMGGAVHGKLTFTALSIVSESELIVNATMELYSGGSWGTDFYFFIVKGIDTSKLADGSAVPLTEVYKVTGTKKVGRANKTLFVVEPVK